MQRVTFPENFLWGTATSSYQIEGEWQAEGKGESIWDRFAHTPGKIRDHSTGDVAVDHYRRYQEDVDLMASLNLQAYRFSISWPRIFPEGRGYLNPTGLDFYDRLVDALLEKNITPFVTLYHWDLPQALEDEGGWRVRSTAVAFADYARAVSQRLGDRVTHWITHNEPWVAAFIGYSWGEHAPGLKDFPSAIRAAHHLMLSHGLAVPIIRANSPGAEVGITLNLSPVFPASYSEADSKAARVQDGHVNRWFLDPLYGRGYPQDMIAFYRSRASQKVDLHMRKPLDVVHKGDLEIIAAATDFLGVNYYSRQVVRDEEAADNQPQIIFPMPEEEKTEMGWEIYPAGLYNILNRLHGDYRVPKLYITENGASYDDAPGENGEVADLCRLIYLRQHFTAAHQAIKNGVPLAGYFVWSLLDNFEWAHGYLQRFGIVWVDFQTQQRIPKNSALWYRDVIAKNGFELV